MTMPKNIIRLLHLISYMCMCTFLTACSNSSWSIFPTRINSQILASFDINPDVNNRPSPLVIRIYELQSITAFNDADFFKLYDEEEATLGADLLSREEFELSPGQGREVTRTPNDKARYFAVIAAFRDIDQARWRVSLPLELNSKNTFVVRVNKHSVTINKR
ncbi:hypothetical protein MNBD_GAMMA09-2783 [hydrothermal vent metagenome]|uniref:Type VI secretion lipoprotein/VasD n=1 Tax=hydrothermal vent metagenome TaxID=652676 RepID=A0A3B0XWV1_9ZZZZ